MFKLSQISFTKKYVFALTLIALLSILAYFNLTTLINKQSNDSYVLNISGKQRMLSQKIALFSIYYKTKALGNHLSLMKKAHTYLTSKPMSEELKEIYYSEPVELDKNVKKYLEHGNKFFHDRNGKSLSYILKNSQIILEKLDLAVTQYQIEAENRTKELKENELLILVITLIALVCEALFIFRPINQNFNKKTKELENEIDFSNTITESNKNAIIAVDKNFRVIIYNKSAVEMFGYSKKEMMNKNSLHKIVSDQYLHEHNIGLSNFMKTGLLKFDNQYLEVKAKRKNGDVFPIRINLGSNNHRENLIVVANIRDISEEQFKDRQLLHQSRYAAMGEMIGNIAHQWRQPLSAISSIASGSVVSKELNVISDKEMCENFDKIKDHTMYLSNTIDDFRNFFRTDDTNQDFELNLAVEQALTLTKALYKDNEILTILKVSDEHIHYQGKTSELSQVIINILHNAKDVLIEKNLEERVVLVNIKENQYKVLIEISDNAGGIPKEIIYKIFDPYFTTKHKSKGTGIGLFMSKEIIEKHFNGVLKVYNREFIVNDKVYFGASFVCELPKLDA